MTRSMVSIDNSLLHNNYCNTPSTVQLSGKWYGLSLQSLLIDAISNDDFELYYQRQTDISGETTIGYEALLRWFLPDVGYISPVDFIAVAESTGMINELGQLVFQKACAQAAILNRNSRKNIRIAVNVSYHQIQGMEFVDYVDSCIKKFGISSDLLEIEITESSLAQNKSMVINVLHGLNEIGVRTSIDDFGTGYSSLNYLASMPFNMIKIDKSFIDLLGIHKKSTAITETIIQMGKKLNMQVLAEGVETKLQQYHLRKGQCDYLQGNLLGKPVPAEKVFQIEGIHQH